MIAPWPAWPADWISTDTESRISRMQELIRFVREVRNRYQVEQKTPLDVSVKCAGPIAAELQALAPFIVQLAGVGRLDLGPNAAKPAQKVSHVVADFEAFVSLVGLIDPAAERARLQKQLAEKTKFLHATQAKLSNEGFVARAPVEVVQQQRDQVAELAAQIAAIERSIAELSD
jgi:valyl-tRNA synthetase